MWRQVMHQAMVGLIFLWTSHSGGLPVMGPVDEFRGQVPVLLYHHLEPDAAGENGAIIAVAEFDQQMAWLQQQGYTSITTRELSSWLAGEGTLPANPVLITFDDGYESNYAYAFPILQRYEMKATIFMISGLAGQTEGDLTYLTWAQMQEMERSELVEIQAHTHDGHHLIGTKPALQVWDAAQMEADLEALSQEFGAAGLSTPSAFAYPFGASSDVARAALPKAGIHLGFTVKPGYVSRTDSSLALSRLVIYPGISITRFARIVTDRPSG
jgi:peptidoglycan/xylan/chitin deacetylase (PgdA/CDA1 family)